MFPRIARSEKKSGVYEYLVISESVHIKGKGSTTHNIANLGNIKKFGIKDIESLIDGLIRIFDIEKYGLSDEVEIIESLEHGSIIFWKKIWDQMNLSPTIKKLISKCESRIKIDAEKYIEIMVINRCAEPHSKLGATRWVDRTCYKAMKGYKGLSLNVEYFYRSMDYLLKIKDELEYYLYEKLKNLFSINVKLTFYDITSTFFYTDNCSIGAFGYSRDKRSDKEQIVIGVVTSYEGYPIKHYVFEGNTKDETTVIEVVKQLKKEFKIQETTFVGDRGMITKLNLDTIEIEGFDYIMGVKFRQSEIFEMILDEDLDKNWDKEEYKKMKIQEKTITIKEFLCWKIQTVLTEKKLGKAPVKLMNIVNKLKNKDKVKYREVKDSLEKQTDDKKIYRKISTLIRKYSGRYEKKVRGVICLNEAKKKVMKKKRELKLSEISTKLEDMFSKITDKDEVKQIEMKIIKVFEGSRNMYKKFYTINYDETTNKANGYDINNKELTKEERYDGIFVLTTSREDISKEKVVESYKNLKEVEALFDDLKHFVDIHPIRHWLEKRVRAHVMLCILGLLLKRIFEINYLKGKATMQPLEEISKSKLVRYEVKFSKKNDLKKIFPKITQTTPEQMQLFNLVGIKNPMSLEKFSW
jgi:transposase